MQVITFKASATFYPKNLEGDFGAVGDGNPANSLLNTVAFIRAGIFFSNLAPGDEGELTIPSFYNNIPAVYIVGKQLSGLDPTFTVTEGGNSRSWDNANWVNAVYYGLFDGMMKINGISKLTIKGSNAVTRPLIKYVDGMYFGTFLRPGQTYSKVISLVPPVTYYYTNNGATIEPLPYACWNWGDGFVNDNKVRAFQGDFITITNSSNITIQDIIINGNNSNVIWGGKYQDYGIQLPNSGIKCLASTNIDISNVDVTEMGEDGVLIDNMTNDVNLNNVKCVRNTRSALAWTGGHTLTAVDCDFDETGKGSYDPTLSNPGTGIDIEPDGPDVCSLGHFINCNFRNNNGSAVHTNQDVYANVDDMWFEGCTMFSSREIGMFCTGKNYKFEQCSIYAAVNWSYVGAVEAEATQFIGCTFEDKNYVNPYTGNSLVPWAHSKPLISIPGAGNVPHPMRWTNFKNCTFKVNDKDREFFWLNWTTSGMPKSTWTVIDDCTFTYNNEGQPGLNASFMRGVRFMGENKVENILNGINSYHMMSMQDATVEGSDNACEPNELTFEGQVEHYLPSSNFGPNFYQTFTVGKKLNNTDGYALYHLNNKALLVTEGNTTMEIGAASSFHVHEGASVYGIQHSGIFVTYGGMVAHKNSHISLEDAVFTHNGNAGANNLLYLDKDANKNNVTLSPLWANGIGYGSGTYFPINTPGWFNGYPNSPNKPCLHGGRLNGNFVCTPHLYTNVLSSGSMNLLYHKHVSCFGNVNNNAFKFEIFGGTPGYTCTLNGNISVYANTPYTLSWGTHTLVVTDANNCQQTFTLVIDTTLEYNIIKGCVAGATPAQFSTNACTQPTVTGPGNISFAGNVCSVTAAGTYTITATSPTSTETKTIYIGDCSACTTAPADAEWYAPNSTSTSISPNGVLDNKPIVLQGNVAVNNEWFIYNNPNVYLTSGALLDLHAKQAIIINSSHMQGCTDFWNGIFAGTNNERVIVNNGSIVQDMDQGIVVSNNSFLQARDSKFWNNNTSIKIFNNHDPNPQSFIYNNEFKGTNTMIANGNGNKPFVGIKLWYTGSIAVGKKDNAAYGNTFENMSTGIWIKQSNNVPLNSTIGIYNNTFTDVHHYPTDYDKLVTCFTYPYGAAIYSDAGGNASNIHYLEVENLPSVSATSFINCDKGIVALGSGLTAKNLKMDNGLLGIMCNSTYSRHYLIEDNIIDNTHLGISLNGQQRSASIQRNDIVTTKTVTRPSGLINGVYTLPIVFVPIGIKYQLSGIPPMQYYTHTIADNEVRINRIGGIGIYNGNADYRLQEKNNEVYFTTTNIVPALNYNIRSLIGYWNENNSTSLYSRNATFGINNPAVWLERNSMGMYMNQSTSCVLDCNRLQYTRYGFYAWGNNTTSKGNVTFNKCNANEFPWFFLDNGSASYGTFGNVGGATDNGNEYISTVNPVDWIATAGINPGPFKVFRNSTVNPGENIFTDNNLLDVGESGPANLTKYGVQPPTIAGYTDPCVEEVLDPEYITGEATVDSSEYVYSMAVVQDSIEYVNYPEVGNWIDKYKLYMNLDEDSMLRNSSPELLYYYNTTTSQTIGDIRFAIGKIALLYDSSTNASNDSLRYAVAMAANTLISSANQWEMNEKLVNDMWLYLYRNPVDSVDSNIVYDLQALASSCPFVEGLAVYRARALWSLWEPNAVFDDRLLCIQGQNKNQDNSNIDIDSLLESQIKEQRGHAQQGNALNETHKLLLGANNSTIKLYPNPAENYIIIEYDEQVNGELIISNNIGQVVMETLLGEGKRKVQLQLKDVAIGLYYYKIKFENKEAVGKLNIIK